MNQKNKLLTWGAKGFSSKSYKDGHLRFFSPKKKNISIWPKDDFGRKLLLVWQYTQVPPEQAFCSLWFFSSTLSSSILCSPWFSHHRIVHIKTCVISSCLANMNAYYLLMESFKTLFTVTGCNEVCWSFVWRPTATRTQQKYSYSPPYVSIII